MGEGGRETLGAGISLFSQEASHFLEEAPDSTVLKTLSLRLGNAGRDVGGRRRGGGGSEGIARGGGEG